MLWRRERGSGWKGRKLQAHLTSGSVRDWRGGGVMDQEKDTGQGNQWGDGRESLLTDWGDGDDQCSVELSNQGDHQD